MTRTENDIRAALLEVAQTAAPADDVANGLHVREAGRANHRRRDSLLIAAACLIVAAVAASALLVTRHQRSAPTLVSPIHMPLGPKFAFSFHVGDLPPALAVVAQGIEPTGQWALVGRKLSADCLPLLAPAQDPERRHKCLGFSPTQGGSATVTNDGYFQLGYVFIFSKEEFDPAVMTAATTVDINGARGLFSEIAQPLSAPALRLGYGSSAPLPTIAWPYARERWAVGVWRNNTDTDARESVIALARATGIGGSHTARVPFTIAHLPASIDRRLELLSGREGDANTVVFGNAASSAPNVEHGLPDRALPITLRSRPLSQVGLSDGPGRKFAASKGDVSLSVAGHPAWYSPKCKWSAQYVSCGATCTLVIGENAANGHLPEGVGEPELINVAKGITVSPSLTDTSTWFNAATALPH